MAELKHPISILVDEEAKKEYISDLIGENIELLVENNNLKEKDKNHKDHCRKTLFENYYNK